MSTPSPSEIAAARQRLQDRLLGFPNIFSTIQSNDGGTRLSVPVEVSGYPGMVYLAKDLLRLSVHALEDESIGQGIDLAAVIDLAIQLLPQGELELLDILHQHHLKFENNNHQ